MTITLTPDLEKALAVEATRRGTTPELLALEELRRIYVPPLPPEASGYATLADFLQGYIGLVEGTGEAFSERCGERFADDLVEKHRKASQ